MSISGIGVIESGLGGTRLSRIPFRYQTKTGVYSLPIPLTQIISAKDEAAYNEIVENQLEGIVKVGGLNTDQFVVYDGIFTDKSNHPAADLIVSVSGISAFANNIYLGEDVREFSWSGLSHTNKNFLWLSMVEQNESTPDYASSREFRDFETRSTIANIKPIGPENSVLVATYDSGVGISTSIDRNKFIFLIDHVEDNQNPHGLRWLQDYMLVSGLDAYGYNYWNDRVGSGLTDSLRYTNVKYLQNVNWFANPKLIVSGILGMAVSGNLHQSLFDNIQTFQSNIGRVGYLEVTSGLTVSGTFFHNHVYLGSGIKIDFIDPSELTYAVSQTCLSGSPFKHTHFLDGTSTTSTVVYPKYPGTVLVPNSVGTSPSKRFEYGDYFGIYRPTIKHKFSGTSFLYVRDLIPTGYNVLESVDVDHKIDSGSKSILCQIRDCVGTLLNPRQGNSLSSSGILTYTVSGFSQVGFSQDLPFDMEFRFDGTISGTNQYLGQIKYNFLTRQT